ncbi:hypothetical protein P170DRAFT_439074 [Aspergillus steynii IBT 23096]|uniref:Protein kinase domain-containing protein n=1 Tax=Aspergillus steynii IBT 23096 TaxID=1392250 RepID=A0A2I2G3E9_9EURO|nr:uncharacterized protein P170DRAFT_439074 [Aspergillus steynii IBT 23096]PLB47402.1 hypothetical protein P170DRAFT_439074 [Aspergillus steynii IBT 23096]
MYRTPYPTSSIDLPKPPIPYIPGWKFPVQSHIPPAPTLVTYEWYLSSKAERVERNQLSPLERCVRNPPLEGPEPREPPHTFELRIVHPIRIGDGHNSQVFVVKAGGTHPLPEDRTLVAKVYDPLYHDDESGFHSPFKCMNQHYTHEARAYEMMSEFQGHLVPRYYGSYTTEIPAGNSRVRTVRLILIEYVEGISLLQVHPNSFSQEIRQQIIKSVIDFDTTVMHRQNIVVRDLSPRNLMILETTALDPKKHLVFVDLAGALFNRRPDWPGLPKCKFLDQYISPLLRWRRSEPLEFGDWVDWDWKPWIEQEYAHTADTITQEMRDVYRD